MVLDLQDTLDRIVGKARVLAERYQALLKVKQELDQKVAELERQLAQRDKELQQLRQEAEYLRTAAVLAPSRDQIEATRAAISNLVREIDRCITDLSD
ncbi:MAG: hypothetical protein LUD17_08180 [Bacteroidales bacterium]|nr:hypothetical protein [Bacteroidales bacterium]MCD8386854.1 hypothetical protein [Bacteroidales bacterium]